MLNPPYVPETITSRGNLEEVLDELHVSEVKIAGLEERIQELETMLEVKLVEMEETEERYLEVHPFRFLFRWCGRSLTSGTTQILKEKKRHLAQITRLKERASFLQQDLVAAKAASISPLPPPVVISLPSPSTSAPALGPAPLSAGKKRVRPSEFDPSLTLPPRAVVATVSRSPSASLAHKKLDQENAPALVQDKRADGTVPLKPEHLVVEKEKDKREPLTIKNVAGLGLAQNHHQLAPNASVDADSGIAALRAKMQRLRTVPPASQSQA